MKFKYLDEVMIMDGFYRGHTGTLTSCDEHYGMEADGSEDSVEYCVQLSKDKSVMVREEMLELVEEDDEVEDD